MKTKYLVLGILMSLGLVAKASNRNEHQRALHLQSVGSIEIIKSPQGCEDQETGDSIDCYALYLKNVLGTDEYEQKMSVDHLVLLSAGLTYEEAKSNADLLHDNFVQYTDGPQKLEQPRLRFNPGFTISLAEVAQDESRKEAVVQGTLEATLVVTTREGEFTTSDSSNFFLGSP